MYPRTNKRRLYQIIEMYLSDRINEPSFCDEFYYSYDLEIDYDTLTDEENHVFGELSDVASRFSEFEEDHVDHPGVYYTKEELRKKILETKNKLKKSFEELEKE